MAYRLRQEVPINQSGLIEGGVERNELNRSRDDECTFRGLRVDVKPRPLLDQEPADVEVALGGGGVQCVPPDGVRGARRSTSFAASGQVGGEGRSRLIRQRTTMGAVCQCVT